MKEGQIRSVAAALDEADNARRTFHLRHRERF